MTSYNQIPFSLEIMKLSSYYKKHREIVTLNTNLEPERYSKFYYFQDFNNIDFPTDIIRQKNVMYCGRYFHPNKYAPFIEEIEAMPADVEIYNIWRKKFIDNNYTKKMFKLLQHTDHVRLSLDGENVWNKAFSGIDFDTNRNTILFHDYDLGQIKDARLAIKDVLNYYTKYVNERRIGMKFPVQTYNIDELLAWNEFKSSGYFYNLEYNGILSDEELDAFYFSQLHTTKMSQFTYNITPEPIDEEEFYQNQIPLLIKQIQRLNQFTTLKLSYNLTFFRNSYIINLLKFINKYAVYLNGKKTGYNYSSMYDYVLAIKKSNQVRAMNGYAHSLTDKWNDLDFLRDLFQYVKDTNSAAFDVMYDRHSYYIEGGQFCD